MARQDSGICDPLAAMSTGTGGPAVGAPPVSARIDEANSMAVTGTAASGAAASASSVLSVAFSHMSELLKRDPSVTSGGSAANNLSSLTMSKSKPFSLSVPEELRSLASSDMSTRRSVSGAAYDFCERCGNTCCQQMRTKAYK